MLLSEISEREALDLEGYICVPKGTLWQKDIRNVWVFDTYEDARKAAASEKGRLILDKSVGGYLLPIQTLNFIPLLLQVSDDGLRAAGSPDFHVYAYSISEQSARMAGLKAAIRAGLDTSAQVWCYKTWNSDSRYFDEDEE